VRIADDLATVERALVENLHRQDLTPLEEAAAFQQLAEDFGLTHEQIASRVGKSRSAITNTLRLMSLPAAVQHLLADGRLSAGHAKALLGCPDRTLQEQLARACAAENWSVRMMEEAIRTGGLRDEPASAPPTTEPERATVERTPPTTRLRPPGVLELEHLLEERLSTRVSITGGERRGTVVIEFGGLDDLERIYRLIDEHPSRAE
jgi:ParB family transcriptional regulator, chromosome partitioning protein